MTERTVKKSIKELSPLDVYKLLPRITPPCGECGEKNCMAFAVKAVTREVALEKCVPLLTEKYKAEYVQLRDLLAPPVKEITVGIGDRSVKIGGKAVQYRHELTYHNPTPIAIDIADEMPDNQILERVKAVESFRYNYIGRILKLDMIAVRSSSNDPSRFGAVVQKVAEATALPLILCSFNPEVIEAGLRTVYNKRPLIYAAAENNWNKMAELAVKYNCPLVVHASEDLRMLKSLVKTLVEYGVEDLVLDPGTFVGEGLANTINNFTMIRRSACGGDKLLGFPILGAPIAVWKERTEPKELLMWKEACLASILLTRYTDILIMHSLEGWVLLPNIIWRFNIYTDPSKPVSVEAGLKIFGTPNVDSPVMITTNYALTFFTVESDIRSANIDCFLIVVDTGGLSVESSVAGRYLTAETITEALRKSGIEEKVKHRYLIIPGLAARLSGDIEQLSGWQVLVGPRDSSGIPTFLKDRWPPKKE
ncbi:acetyl-CoA decarbonylase/synthase complex subunit gamma [Candidatus Bathyarchaeota archaeon]|nr:acetyl-CoA decarbonylase/synthase complex subunit gamma [Candidatus Bathyarchaeota archaeon]